MQREIGNPARALPSYTWRMGALVYFDTDVFHRFASTFESCPLPDDLRPKILLSPMTMKEVFSHLALVKWGPDIHAQIKGLPNWLGKSAGHLPWMTDAMARIAFGVPLPDDGFTQGLQDNINELLNYQLDEVLDAAESLRDELDKIKNVYAGYFKDTMDYFSKTLLTEQRFTEVWVNGIKRRLHLENNTTPAAQVVDSLSAYHEFEFNKLKAAVASKGQYNAQKHRNDLFDAEQLVYLKDPNLHFLVIDQGYRSRVVKSPLRDRIHQATLDDLEDAGKAESLLRQIAS
jgi:hypothetical protein